MRTSVALWIDHRKAIVAAITDKEEVIRLRLQRRDGDAPQQEPARNKKKPICKAI